MTRLILAVSMMALCLPGAAFAQDDVMPVAIDIQKPDIAPVEPFPDGYRSLMFTAEEHARIMAALGRRQLAAPAAPLPTVQEGQVIDRVLHLSGIVYANPRDWTIWLNGRRITPREQPDEVRGLRVSRDAIELQWYDAVNEAVVPVRLRPQQRFSLDTHSFVPVVGDPVPAVPPAEIDFPYDELDDEDEEAWYDDEAMLWELLTYDLP